MAYELKTVKLDTVTADIGTEIVPRNRAVTHVACDNFPQGASCALAFGDNPFLPIVGPFAFDLCGDDGEQGIRLKVDTAQAGVSFSLLVAYGGIRSNNR